MALLNYSTKLEPEQTIGEIQKMLSRCGVAAMMTEYDGPHVAAVSFKLNIDGKPLGFRLPCNWRAVRTIFDQPAHARRLKCSYRERDAQAIRTSWRIIKDWVEAQLALIEVGMVTVPQVFLPYTIMRDGRTLSEHAEADPSFLLGPAN